MITSLGAGLLGLVLAVADAPPPQTEKDTVDVVTGAPPINVAGNATERIKQFRERAFTLKRLSFKEALAHTRSSGPSAAAQAPRAGFVVVDGKGEFIPDDKLAGAAKDPTLGRRYLWMNRQEALASGMRVGAVGLLVASVPLGAVIGLAIGAAIGIALAIRNDSVMTGVAGAGIGLGAGLVAGLVLGGLIFLTNVALVSGLLFSAYTTRAAFYAGAVRNHNTALAQELNLERDEVGAEYFPADGAERAQR